MSGEYGAEVVADLEAMVRKGLDQWSMPPDAEITLLNLSENATFRIDAPDDRRRIVLRLHRLGYHTGEEIRSELAWIEALRADGAVRTPRPIPCRNGNLLTRLISPTIHEPRHAVAFDYAPGHEPEAGDDLGGWFRDLGRLTAHMHRHARGWRPPPGFQRKTLDFDAFFGDRALWGSWRRARGLDPQGAMLLKRALDLIERRLARFGRGPERFGLIHADLRLANLLVDDPHLRVIDFDDCGFGWFGYDFATAVSFFEDDPKVPALMDSWAAGYRAVLPLPAEEVAELPVFIAMRRILLTAWLASHAEVPLAQELGPTYTDGTLRIAEDLLSRFS